jgi:hypothetical protein
MINRTSTFVKLAAAASVALAGAALAHPHEGGDAEKTQKIIVLSKRADGAGTPGPVREFRMMRGQGGEFTCPNGDATKIDETTGGERTKVLICTDDKLSKAEHAEKLEGALERMRSQDHLGGEHKAKVEAALQEAIARLRASN